MGLPVRQRTALDHIERGLQGSDPRLVALYAIFARLTNGEEMPRFEQLRHGVRTRFARLRRVVAAVAIRLRLVVGAITSRRRRRLWPRQRILLFYPLAIALAVGSIVLAVRSGPSRSCLPTRAVAAAKNGARSNLCRPPGYVSPLTYGR